MAKNKEKDLNDLYDALLNDVSPAKKTKKVFNLKTSNLLFKQYVVINPHNENLTCLVA